MNPTMLSHWCPLIKAAGLPIPDTTIIPGLTAEETWDWADGDAPPSSLGKIAETVRAAGEAYGFPCFLRTGLTSGKHDWNDTCFLRDPRTVEAHLYQLVEFSCMADLIGLECSEFVVRKLLPSISVFTAFKGMPVAREIRYFYEGGRISGWAPYWPADSIQNPSRDDWRERLEVLQAFTSRDLETTAALAERAAVAASSGGLCADWSIDLLHVRDGSEFGAWFVTDMADAARSYRSPDFRKVDEGKSPLPNPPGPVKV